MRQQLGGPSAADHIARRHAGHTAVIHQCGAGHQGALRAHLFPVAAQQLHHVPWFLQGGNRVHHISKLRRQAHIVFQHHQRGGVAGQQLAPGLDVAGVAAFLAIDKRLVVQAVVAFGAVEQGLFRGWQVLPPYGGQALARQAQVGELALDAGAAFAVLVKIDEDQGQCLLLHGLPMNRRRES